MSELPALDITDYFYQKLSYYIIFEETIRSKAEVLVDHLSSPRFWKIFQRQLSFLLYHHCLLEPEVQRIYYVFGLARTFPLDAFILQIINESILKLNDYRVDMDTTYNDEIYITEMNKRFPTFKEKNIGDCRPLIQKSLAMDFPFFWGLTLDDEEIFAEDILPSLSCDYPFISNIRAFAVEMPDLFTTEVFYHRVELLIAKWEQDAKEYNLKNRFKTKQMIRQCKKYLK